MKVQVQTEQLKEALDKILSVVDKKNTRPILTYTLLTFTDNKIELSATDLEVSAKVVIDAIVEKNDSFCVNAKNLFEIVRELPNTTLKLELENNFLKLFCEDIHYSLLIFNSDDFPPLSFENKSNAFNLSVDNLQLMINKTSHAISNDETRLHLNGIFLHEFEGRLRAVATDGHRLSMIDFDLNNPSNDILENGIIIPKKGVAELKKLAESDPSGSIEISVDESFIYAKGSNDYSLSVRLISREYPKYQKVIPAKTSYEINVDKEPFSNAIRRVKIMSNEKSNGIKVFLSEGQLVIKANHPSLGDATEKIEVNYVGPEMEIGFNAKYFLDLLSVLDDGDIIIELDNELKPIVVKSDKLPSYLGIIMPLKL